MFLSLLFATTLSFSTYTNHAGQVVRACPLALTNGVVTVALDGARRARYPLSIFPEPEQRRIKSALGVREPAAARPSGKSLRGVFDERRRALDAYKASERRDPGKQL